ncbi:MAG: YfiR family protein [Bacteroidota bacterium]
MKNSILALLISSALMSFSEANRPEHELHAMMVYNFIRYIEWPSSGQEFTIGVIGDESVFSTLHQWYDGKLKGGKTFRVVMFNSVGDVQKCNIIYMGNQSKAKLTSVTKKLEDQSTLLITNKPGYGKLGSGINFTTEGNKLRFELNQQAVKAAGLKVSSQLTAIAILL